MEMRRRIRHQLPTGTVADLLFALLADLLFALLVIAIGAAWILAAALL